MSYPALFGRGLLIVTLTAYNVSSIAQGHYWQAVLGGFGISFVWWGNSRSAAHSELRWAREVYSLGAACGTALGIWLAQ